VATQYPFSNAAMTSLKKMPVVHQSVELAKLCGTVPYSSFHFHHADLANTLHRGREACLAAVPLVAATIWSPLNSGIAPAG
jgi:hypothetical protein